MFIPSHETVKQFQYLVEEVAVSTDMPKQEVLEMARAHTERPDLDEVTTALEQADTLQNNPQATTIQREIARLAIFGAPYFNDTAPTIMASMAYLYMVVQRKGIMSGNEFHCFYKICDDVTTSFIRQYDVRPNTYPDSNLSKDYRFFMHLAHLFQLTDDDALRRLRDYFGIHMPARYPVGMLADQLHRYDRMNTGENDDASEALIMVGADDPVGALTFDNVYKSIRDACAQTPQQIVPTIVEFGNDVSCLMTLLSEPRNVALGFINAHGNWDNFNGITKEELVDPYYLDHYGLYIAANWRYSAGIALLSCYGGAQSTEGEDGIDTVLAALTRKPIVASDAETTDVTVDRRRTAVADRWTVEFHVPLDNDNPEPVATRHIPQQRTRNRRAGRMILDRKTVASLEPTKHKPYENALLTPDQKPLAY